MIICPNLSNPNVAQEFNELKSALVAADSKHGEAMAYQVWSLNNGNAIDKAPNGAESQLFKSLVDWYEGDRSKAIIAKAKTYSTNFLKWFGNWTGEKDALPESVSKVVDENGEPLVVWHGSNSRDVFEEFVYQDIENGGFWFSSEKITASTYTQGYTEFVEPDFHKYTEEQLKEIFRKCGFQLEFREETEDDFPFPVAFTSYQKRWFIWDGDTETSFNVKDIYELSHKLFNLIKFKPDILNKFEKQFGNIAINHINLRPFFLNIKNPLTDLSENIRSWKKVGQNGVQTTRDVMETAFKKNNDGVIINNVVDVGHNLYNSVTKKYEEELNRWLNYDFFKYQQLKNKIFQSDVYAVFNSDQIKSVDNRDGEYTGQNIYHNEGEFDSWNEEQQKYYIWLPGAKQRLALASQSNIEQVKSDIRKEFDGFKFKHFTLSIKKNERGEWYILTKNRKDQKDVKDLRIIAKKIGHTELGVHELSGDQVENLMKYLFSEVHGTSEHMNNIISILKAALKGKNIKIQFVREKVETSPAYYNHETGVITINVNGAFKNSNGYNNIVAQTVLHELIHAITVETIKHSPELRNELEILFNKVKTSARISYNNHPVYGLKDIYEFLAELSNEDFVKSLQNIHTGSNRKELISTIIDFMRKVINKILTSINKQWKGTAYADAMEILMKAAFPEDFNIKQQSEPLDEKTIFNAMSDKQQAAQDEANRLIVRMNVLYRQYEKIKDKTPAQERLANQIFETLNKLKRSRNISAVRIALDQAKLTLGQLSTDTGYTNIYKYLRNAQQNGFQGLSPQHLVDMYRNSIKFYKDLIENIPSEHVIDLTEEDKKSIADLKSLIDDHIMPMWTQAIMVAGDQIVDDQIDSEVFASEENKEDMKKVAKDWLHKNLMYGDSGIVTSYIYNYSNSSDPIIKQAFHLIQSAEQKTLEEVHGIAPKLMAAYQKANSGSRSFTPGWQSMMMEFDNKGIPTGNFVREINYGLYQKDLKEFIEQLNQAFIDKYGFTYVVDDSGAVTNSLTGEFAEDEEWGPNGEKPKYIEYLEEIEIFKAPRVHRKYIPDYYFERLSRSYNGTIDPFSEEFKNSRFDHGLSPKTLAKYTYYNSNINYYLNKCQDPKTGLVYPERLSKDDQFSLDKWKSRLDEFTSIFNKDGSYKVGEDLKMAYEVRAWQKWVGSYNDPIIHQDEFNIELNEIKQQATNNPKMVDDFIRYNSVVGINPDFIEQTVGSLKSHKGDTDASFRGKLMRASLQGMVNNPRIFGRELIKMANNPLFWLQCKTSDQAIESANDPQENKGTWTKEQVEEFEKNFYYRDILYTDEYGYYIDEYGNKINPNDKSAKVLEDAGKLLTFRTWLINKYTDEAFRTGQVTGLIDESTGNPIDFSGLTQLEIKNHISKLLSYQKTYWDKEGNVDHIEYEPLTIFSILSPKHDTFLNGRTGRKEHTVILVGNGRFKQPMSSLIDDYYMNNNRDQVSELPDNRCDNFRYDNSDNYNKVMKDEGVRELYEILVDTMKYAQSLYSTNRKFNYRLPQINARTAALVSRLVKSGYSVKAIQGLWNSITKIEENDELLRTKQDYFIGVDGEVANDVPLKFIHDIKDKQNLSTDLVSSVILFADMAINYKNKREIDSKLKVLRYNMDTNIRDVYEKKLKPKSEQSAKSNKNSVKMFDSMMDVSMYGNKFGNPSEEGPSKTRVAVHKTADAFQSLESTAMLGLNMFSMFVGFGDSMTRIFSESVAGKYMTIGDCLWALGKVLYYTPACIFNMFNPLANNKMTALMQMNGISKGTFATYTKTDWGRGRKFFNNILMGGWSMLDWMANALLMTAFYHNCRFFEGIVENGVQIIKPGFYTKYELQQEFLKVGKSKSEANSAHGNIGNILNVTEYEKIDKEGNVVKGKIHGRITLWDAYQFAPYYKNEKGEIKKAYGHVEILKEYEPFVTQRVKTNIATRTKKRGALYNGMNPDNDVPRWKRDVLGRLAGALRAWIQQQLQHLIAGGTDNIVRTFSKVQTPEVTTSGTRMKTRYTKDKLSDEQRSRRMSWDYETDTPQDQILVGLFRSFKTLYREAYQMLLHKPRTAKLSEVEKYAWKDAIIFLAMLAMMMVGWTFVHDWAREVPKPKSRAEAGPASMLNPIDYYTFIRDVYIPNDYYKLGVDNVFFRIVEAKISSVNVQQVLDIVNALTALKSGFDNQLGVIELSSTVIGDEDDLDGILKQGGYKFYTKGEKLTYKAVGPVNNMHTFLTYYGSTGNLRWYTNKFGRVYRAFEYDFKTKDKNAGKKNTGGGFTEGSFSEGGFSEGNFSEGNFSE